MAPRAVWGASIDSIPQQTRVFFLEAAPSERVHHVILGTTAFAGILSASAWPPWISISAAAAITAFSALDLVLGFADRAKEHAELRRQFIGIESCMAGAADEKQLKTCIKDRLAIEATEPPKKFALDVLCHNELLRAEGRDINDPEDAPHFCNVTRLQRLTANIWPWEGAKFPPVKPAAKHVELAAT